VIVAYKGVLDRLVRNASDGLQQFPGMLGIKGFENDNAIFSYHEHRVIPFTWSEAVDAIADFANAVVLIGSEHKGGREN
jgi:hypothetical protein